jgi:hypothetical protein
MGHKLVFISYVDFYRGPYRPDSWPGSTPECFPAGEESWFLSKSLGKKESQDSCRFLQENAT